MKIEVELRSFITKKKYEELGNYFRDNADFLDEDEQETVYLSAPLDLRIQKNKKGVKIWAKEGEMHDSAREEIELFCRSIDYDSALSLFKKLGYEPYISWWRKRRSHSWRGVTVALDYTRHYGYILELEQTVNQDKEKALKKLTALMSELNITPTPKEIFNTRYKSYVEKHHLKK